MKANDVMRGDFVYFEKLGTKLLTIGRVNQIMSETVLLDYTDPESYPFNKHCWQNDDYFIPIPLTPKIIENAGFSKWIGNNGNNWRMITYLREIYVFFDDIDKRPQVRIVDKLSGDSLILTYCGFVHELQHALKMTNTELEFKFE